MRNRELAKEINDKRAAAAKEVATSIRKLAVDARNSLEQLTDMAPGLNRNPYVQNLRVQLETIRTHSDALI